MFDLIEKLCNLNGTSGDEKIVAEFIIEKARKYTNYIKVDNIGNVIVFKKGRNKPKTDTIMVSAHMDEVGFIVTYIEENGLIRFASVGGINSEILLGNRVTIGQNNVLGIIGNKPKHLLDNNEENRVAKFDKMFIDIGTTTKEETLKHINIGDFAYFSGEVKNIGDGLLIGKAFDDRVGCAIMLEMLKDELEYDTYFSFNTREEVGCIGAKTASYYIKPTLSLVLECTTSGDNIGFSGADKICNVGGGTVISYMDKACIYDYTLFEKSKKLATQYDIKYQLKSGIYGGNDSKNIQMSNSGCRVMALSAPARNLHTQSIVISKSDITDTKNLALRLINNII